MIKLDKLNNANKLALKIIACVFSTILFYIILYYGMPFGFRRNTLSGKNLLEYKVMYIGADIIMEFTNDEKTYQLRNEYNNKSRYNLFLEGVKIGTLTSNKMPLEFITKHIYDYYTNYERYFIHEGYLYYMIDERAIHEPLINIFHASLPTETGNRDTFHRISLTTGKNEKVKKKDFRELYYHYYDIVWGELSGYFKDLRSYNRREIEIR